MTSTTQRLTAIAGLAVAAVLANAGAALADVSVPVPGSGNNCVFVGSFSIGNPLYPGDIFKTDPKTGVYISNNCPH